jgi:hypothetical protein
MFTLQKQEESNIEQSNALAINTLQSIRAPLMSQAISFQFYTVTFYPLPSLLLQLVTTSMEFPRPSQRLVHEPQLLTPQQQIIT